MKLKLSSLICYLTTKMFDLIFPTNFHQSIEASKQSYIRRCPPHRIKVTFIDNFKDVTRSLAHQARLISSLSSCNRETYSCRVMTLTPSSAYFSGSSSSSRCVLVEDFSYAANGHHHTLKTENNTAVQDRNLTKHSCHG